MSRTNAPAVPAPDLGFELMWAPWVGWAVPGLALVIVAVSTLTQRYGPARNLVDVITALVVALLTLLALTRTAQEALVNTAKHAPHQPVRITLDYQPGCTMLSVANPFAASSEDCPGLETVNGGYGLAGMRERLLLIDGSLSAGPDHGDWVVTAQVPQ